MEDHDAVIAIVKLAIYRYGRYGDNSGFDLFPEHEDFAPDISKAKFDRTYELALDVFNHIEDYLNITQIKKELQS